MATASLTLQVPVALKERLERVAESLQRSDEAVALDALDSYVAREEAFAAKVRRGLEAADRGEIVPDDEVKAFFRKWGYEG